MKAITLMTTIIDYSFLKQGYLINQDLSFLIRALSIKAFLIRTMLIKLRVSLSRHINGNRVSLRLIDYHYKLRKETQIRLLIKGSTRAPISQETKVKTEISIEIHLRDLSLLLRSIIRTKIKKIRLWISKRSINNTKMLSIRTRLRKTLMIVLLSKASISKTRSIKTQSKLTLLYLPSQLCSHIDFIRISLTSTISFIDISMSVWSL